MKQKRLSDSLWKFFQFIKVVDADKTLSLTNLAVIIVLVKLATAKDAISPVDIGGLVGVMLPYTGKKWIAKLPDRSKDSIEP